MKQRLLKYKSNRSWGDTRLEAFYWAVIRNKSFGSILDPSDFDTSEYLSVEETNAFIKEMLMTGALVCRRTTMNKEIKYLNESVLSDIQMLEVKTLYIGLRKHTTEVLSHCFSGEYFDKWEMVLLEEKLAEMIQCLADVTDNVAKVSRHITVNDKKIVASLSADEYKPQGDRYGEQQ
jgi:hypothetical protein